VLRRAMPLERQVQHQTATQPVREAWLQTERQELAKPQQTVSPLEQPGQMPHQMAMEEPVMPPRRVNLPEQQHQTETREPVTRLQTAIRPEQVSRQRKERRRRKVKRGPAQTSEPQRPRTAKQQAQHLVLPRQRVSRLVQQQRKAMLVRQQQTVKRQPAAAEVPPRQT